MHLISSRIILLFLIFMGLTAVYAQKGEYRSKPFTGTSPKDGKAYLDIMQYDDKSKFMYVIRNDEVNLYIDILLSDREAIQRTMMFGLTTWIDPTAKKKKDIGIVFPMESNNGMGMSRKGEGKDPKEMMALAMQEKNSMMLLKGFDGKGSERVINPMVSQGFKGKFEMLEGEKVRVALTVPLARIGREGEAMALPLGIGFETGYMDLNHSGMAAAGGPRGGDDHYHGGGPPGGGLEGPGAERQRPDLNALATPSKLWVKRVVLFSGE